MAEVEFIPVFAPLTIADESTVGTAGTIGFRPFTGDTLSGFPCGAGTPPPTGPDGFAMLEGDEEIFLVALA